MSDKELEDSTVKLLCTVYKVSYIINWLFWLYQHVYKEIKLDIDSLIVQYLSKGKFTVTTGALGYAEVKASVGKSIYSVNAVLHCYSWIRKMSYNKGIVQCFVGLSALTSMSMFVAALCRRSSRLISSSYMTPDPYISLVNDRLIYR